MGPGFAGGRADCPSRPTPPPVFPRHLLSSTQPPTRGFRDEGIKPRLKRTPYGALSCKDRVGDLCDQPAGQMLSRSKRTAMTWALTPKRGAARLQNLSRSALLSMKFGTKRSASAANSSKSVSNVFSGTSRRPANSLASCSTVYFLPPWLVVHLAKSGKEANCSCCGRSR